MKAEKSGAKYLPVNPTLSLLIPCYLGRERHFQSSGVRDRTKVLQHFSGIKGTIQVLTGTTSGAWTGFALENGTKCMRSESLDQKHQGCRQSRLTYRGD